MKKTELRVDVIYHLIKGLEGLKICVIESNRNNPKQNARMLEGCLSEGMQQPGIFTDARLAMEAGYTLKDVEDGHIINTDEVDDYVVIADGNTRFHAFMSSLNEGSKGTFDYKFHLMQYADAATFRTAYQKMNIFNNPTKAEDFARDLMATSTDPVLASYRAKIKDGLVPKASGFATIGREIVKKISQLFNKGKHLPASMTKRTCTVLTWSMNRLSLCSRATSKASRVLRYGSSLQPKSTGQAIRMVWLLESQRCLRLCLPGS